MMQAETQEIFESEWGSFKSLFGTDYPIFMAYFEKMWLGRKELWSKAWRPVSTHTLFDQSMNYCTNIFHWKNATFHTNNMIESYHNQLKSFYLTRSRNKRVDRVVYTLVHLVVCDYRSEHVQVEFGLKDMPLNAAQSKRKREADRLDLNEAQSMVNTIIVNDETVSCLHYWSNLYEYWKKTKYLHQVYTCCSFTSPRIDNVLYTVTLDPSGTFIANCSCLDNSPLCKHMFLVSRTHSIPYYDPSNITRPYQWRTLWWQGKYCFRGEFWWFSCSFRTAKTITLGYFVWIHGTSSRCSWSSYQKPS